MAFISFELTEKEFMAGIKTCTRRDWAESYRKKWVKWFQQGKIEHDAWNKVPYHGGKLIGRFRLTCAPYLERLAYMPVEDLVAEGGMCKSKEEFCLLIGKKQEDFVTVIRFVKL